MSEKKIIKSFKWSKKFLGNSIFNSNFAYEYVSEIARLPVTNKNTFSAKKLSSENLQRWINDHQQSDIYYQNVTVSSDDNEYALPFEVLEELFKLPQFSKIKNLSVTCYMLNEPKEDLAKILENTIEKNSATLEKIDIHGNVLNEDFMLSILKSMLQCQNLVEITIYSNERYGDEEQSEEILAAIQLLKNKNIIVYDLNADEDYSDNEEIVPIEKKHFLKN